MRKSFTLIELLVVIAIIAILIGLLGGGGVWIAQSIWYLVAGWGYFVLRKVPKAEPSIEATLTGILAVLLLIGIMHLVMRRFVNRPANDELPARNWTFRSTSALVGVIALLFAAGVSAIGITHQSTWLATTEEPRVQRRGSLRDTGAHLQSQNNLKNMGIALHEFDGKHKSLPMATSTNASGRLMHGWQTHLLPYVEQEALYKTIDLQRPWNDPSNRQPFGEVIKVYQSPFATSTHDDAGHALSHYAANVHALGGERPKRFDDFPRGLANTILAGEVTHNVKPWAHPLNVRDPRLGLQKSPEGFGGPRPGRTQFLMADGSVRTFTTNTESEFLELIGGP